MPRRDLNVAVRRSDRVANTQAILRSLGCLRITGLPRGTALATRPDGSVVAPGVRLVAGTTSDGRDGAGTEWCGRRPRPTYGCVPWGAPLRRRPL
ncbi:hypothetical protein GCM10027212_37160 [Actinotalea caeni]